MGRYLILSKLTGEGGKTIKEHPERIKEVNKEVEAMGAKVVTQYALLGQYDFATILEAPSNETIAKVTLELGSRGTLHTMTLPAMRLDDFIAYMKK